MEDTLFEIRVFLFISLFLVVLKKQDVHLPHLGVLFFEDLSGEQSVDEFRRKFHLDEDRKRNSKEAADIPRFFQDSSVEYGTPMEDVEIEITSTAYRLRKELETRAAGGEFRIK
jgi:hypothetical protein